MKQFFTIGFFSLAFFLGSQTMEAQSKLEMNQAASEQTIQLRKLIKFDKEQQHKIFDAYLKYEKAVSKLNTSASNTNLNEEKEKINAVLVNEVQAILTDEQFEMFKDIKQL